MAAQLRTTRSRSPAKAALIALACVFCHAGLARAATPARPAAAPRAPASAASGPAIENSDLDARLMYELLIGEIELNSGDPGTAFQVILDAAKKTGNEQLFRHATEIALQARAGEQALEAARAWAAAAPQSLDAQRYIVQLLVGSGKVGETAEPLRAMLKLTPVIERPSVIGALPGLYARAEDHKAAATVIEQALKPYAASAPTAVAARVAIGRAWLIAGDRERALAEATAAAAQEPASPVPPQLALELMGTTPAAEAIVQRHLAVKPDSNDIRLLYARVLSGAQRYAEAVVQLDAVTRSNPELAAPWLTLGALHLELNEPAKATAALQHYVSLSPASIDDPSALTETDTVGTAGSALDQAYLMLAQAAELQGDYPAASAWLDKVTNPQRALEVQTRRASLLARQGHVDDALAMIRNAPERAEGDARLKLAAQEQVLRQAKRWQAAYDLLAQANTVYPDDPDLLYEQSMMAEKLDRVDDSERLLRRVIALRPDNSQAHNALGYSLADRNRRLPEAKALIEKALSLSPGEPFITDSLGWVEYRMGNSAEALRLLRGAYQQRPDPEIAAHLGEVLWVSGHHDEARRILREGRDRDAANDVLKETVARLRVDL